MRITNYELRITNAWGGCRQLSAVPGRAVTPILLVLMVGLGGPTYAASLYVDDGVNKQIATASWGAGGLPARPNYEWRFASANGLDYDTTGADSSNQYRNYGQTGLATGLTDGNRPSLNEGVIQPHQGGLALNGSTNYLENLDPALLNVGTNKLSIIAVIRPTLATCDVVTKHLSAGDQRSYALSLSSNRVACSVSKAGTAGSLTTLTTTATITASKWNSIGMTWQGDSLKAFINGSFSKGTAYLDSIYQSTATFFVGKAAYQGTYFAGDIAWVGVWIGASALTNAEVSAVHTALFPTGASGSPYPSVQAAVYQASAGDTILVRDGRYQETVTVATALDYIGAATAVYDSIPELYGAALPAAAGNDGLTVSADNEIGFLTVRGYGSQGLLGTSTSDGSLFHHLEFDSCLNAVDFDGAASGDTLVNCTIDGANNAASTGFRATTSSAVTVVVENCIFVNTNTALTKAALQTLTETNNDFYGNTTNYASALHATDLLVKPLFYGGNDYRVPRRSQVLDAGVEIRNGSSPFDRIGRAATMGIWDGIQSRYVGRGNLTIGNRHPFARYRGMP